MRKPIKSTTAPVSTASKVSPASVTRAGSPTPPSSGRSSADAGWPAAKVEAKPGVNISPSTGGQPTREAIAEAAYFLWLRRGGNELVNWLEAEASLRAKSRAAV
jgi:hypothetical protein